MPPPATSWRANCSTRGDITAIFASNDLLAIGVLRAAAERGLAVPGALSVIGFDGIDLGGYMPIPRSPRSAHPIRAMGETAATVLIERIAEAPTSCREVVLGPQLLMRESTGPVPAALTRPARSSHRLFPREPMTPPTSTPTTEPRPGVRMVDINKRFGSVQANARRQTSSVWPGTVHGLVGENGAGKSTLMSVLYGFYGADSRHASQVDGAPVRIRNAYEAIALGLGMVHQHFMLVRDPDRDRQRDAGRRTACAAAGAPMRWCASACRRTDGVHRPSRGRPGRDRSATSRSATGSAWRSSRRSTAVREILILDEPTAVLTPQETEQPCSRCWRACASRAPR